MKNGWNTCSEVKDAPGGTHLISRMLDKTMVSIFGCNQIFLMYEATWVLIKCKCRFNS